MILYYLLGYAALASVYYLVVANTAVCVEDSFTDSDLLDGSYAGRLSSARPHSV